MLSLRSCFCLLTFGSLLSFISYSFAESSTCSLTVPSSVYTPVGTLATRNTSAITNPYSFSIGAECMDRNYTIYDNWKAYLAPLGAKEARIQGGWYRCETVKGVYNYSWLDTIVYDMVHQQNVIPWIQLSYGNPNYGNEGGIPEPNSPLPNGTALTAFLTWTTTTVQRYSTVGVTTWEIWNEPEIGKIAPEDYALFAIQVAQTVRKVQPNAILRFGVFAGVDVNYASAILPIFVKTNSINLFNVLTYHPYSYNPDDVYDEVASLSKVVTDASSSLIIAQGENGAPSVPFTYGALGDYNWTQCSQSKWFSRRIMGDRSRNIPTSSFTIVDICYITNGQVTVNTKGIISANCTDKTVTQPKLAYGTVQRLFSTMDNTLNRVPTGNYTVDLVPVNSAANPSSIYTSLFLSNDGKNNIIFSAWNSSTTPTNADQTVTHNYNVTLTIPLSVFQGYHRGMLTAGNSKEWRLADLLTGTVYRMTIMVIQEGNNLVYTLPMVPITDFAILAGDENVLPINTNM